MWDLPVPGGPRKCTTSARVTKSSCARAAIRSRSREGWKEKSKLLQRLDRHQLGGAQGDVDAAGFPGRVFFAEQAGDRLDGGELAAFEPGQGVIQRLQCTRHPEPDQRAPDAIEELAHCGPPAARRRPTAS